MVIENDNNTREKTRGKTREKGDKMEIKDNTINETVLVLSHYIRSLRGGGHNEEWVDRVKLLRGKLLNIRNNKLLEDAK